MTASIVKKRKMPIVGSVMTSFPYFVEADAPIAKIEQIMIQHGVRHLPVQHKGKVVGIVAERDLRYHVRRSMPQEEKDKICARDIMVSDPYVVSFRTPLNEVVFEMARRRIGSVIVQRNGKLAGILSVVDVCRILGEYLENLYPRPNGDTAA